MPVFPALGKGADSIANMSNYVKISRKILEWGWYRDEHTKSLFLHCLLKANWKDGEFKGIVIKRGQFATSIPKLQVELELTSNEVRTAIKHLKSTGEITVRSYSKFSVITVVKYDSYQCESQAESQADNSHTTDKAQPINSLLTTIEEGKKNKKERKENISNSVRFTPPSLEEVQDYCKSRRNGLDAQAFVDFYSSKGWMIGKNKMKDWKAAVRTWERKSQTRQEETAKHDRISEVDSW